MSNANTNMRSDFAALWASWDLFTLDNYGISSKGVYVDVPVTWFDEHKIKPIGEPCLDKLAYRSTLFYFLDYVAFKDCEKEQ